MSNYVPIGPHPAHLVAELSLIPVDGFLQSLGLPFCRYVDDIHIFCKSSRTARSALFKFADYMDKTQKINLNRQNANVFETSTFIETCRDNAVDKPISTIESDVLHTVRSYTKSPYERVRIVKVSAPDRKKLSQKNIEDVLAAYLDVNEVDYVRLRWFIRRLTQVGAPGRRNQFYGQTI